MTMKSRILTACVATAAISTVVMTGATVAHAGDAMRFKSIEEQLDAQMIRLIIKRENSAGGTYYDTQMVPVSDWENVKAELLRQPDVINVERDVFVSIPNPRPVEVPPVTVQSYSVGDVPYNDPLYNELRYFAPGEQYNSRIQEAHGRLKFTNPVRIGIADVGFIRSDEVNYVDGYSFDHGRGAGFYNSDPNVGCTGENEYLHGNYVAQVAAAIANNAIGTTGVVPGAEVVAGRVFDCDGFGTLFSVAEAVNWMAGNGPHDVPPLSEPVDVINLSLGAPTECPTYMQDAIDNARAAGIAVVVATGNDNIETIEAPANCEGVIAVASTTEYGTRSSFSNYGAGTTIAAQGSNIPVLHSDGTTRYVYGTSFATPIVTGLIAATLSDRPELTPADIDRIVAESGKPGRNITEDIGAGIIDSMLFLDGAGVVREVMTAQHVLTGEREQYLEALTHPRATQFIQNASHGATACDFLEVDGSFASNATENDTLMVFSARAGAPLDPTTPENVLAQTGGDRLLVRKDYVEYEVSQGNQIGIARCNVNTGDNCSVVDTVRGLDHTQIQSPAICL
ncbi:hypothetical protein BTO32_15145 [Marinobacter lutaoensis]|uniref:Peptidase S8/S53 domain-containing protein n=1 Tax=Marinobacter lutaoensis TaxID=135739 RepID=A0A1V2DPI8_9GAMM|nr:S8 family serine peptidase [Marinobacter lutaoensis]ONF42542.1 hypothetical protein BTO32_15145 [Marinobacter lutaoensis]